MQVRLYIIFGLIYNKDRGKVVLIYILNVQETFNKLLI